MILDPAKIGICQLFPTDDGSECDDGLTEIQKRAARIVQAQSSSRVDTYGGYADQFAFIENLIVIASQDHDDAPDLTITDVEAFVEEHHYWLEDEAA